MCSNLFPKHQYNEHCNIIVTLINYIAKSGMVTEMKQHEKSNAKPSDTVSNYLFEASTFYDQGKVQKTEKFQIKSEMRKIF